MRSSGISDLVELEGELVHQTERAWLVKFESKTVWLPKSMVEREGANIWIMPQALGEEKEIV